MNLIGTIRTTLLLAATAICAHAAERHVWFASRAAQPDGRTLYGVTVLMESNDPLTTHFYVFVVATQGYKRWTIQTQIPKTETGAPLSTAAYLNWTDEPWVIQSVTVTEVRE